MGNPLWFNEDEPNAREEEILGKIRQYLADHQCDTHSAGYDEGFEDGVSRGEDMAWSEARNTGYDEGWEDACNYIITKILDKKSGLVVTPDSKQDLSIMLEAYNDKGIMCVMMFQNYLADRLQELKVDKA